MLISIPGDMDVKEACIRFEEAARDFSREINSFKNSNSANPILKEPYIWKALTLLGSAEGLCEALKEATTKRSRTDRLQEWWLLGKYQ